MLLMRPWRVMHAPLACVCTRITASLFKMMRSEEHTSELQSRGHLVCRLLLEKKNKTAHIYCPSDEGIYIDASFVDHRTSPCDADDAPPAQENVSDHEYDPPAEHKRGPVYAAQ